MRCKIYLPRCDRILVARVTDYQTLNRLQEYVLINTQHRRVEIFRRHSDDLWVFQTYENCQTFHLKSIDYTGTFEMLYEDVSLESIALKIIQRVRRKILWRWIIAFLNRHWCENQKFRQ